MEGQQHQLPNSERNHCDPRMLQKKPLTEWVTLHQGDCLSWTRLMVTDGPNRALIREVMESVSETELESVWVCGVIVDVVDDVRARTAFLPNAQKEFHGDHVA